ncbi:DUF6543 domain-containing protein [Paraburkholderia aromaticivorans]|uniref:DUF6543 domain-containing protein n=1 Tax=Paraburkholderia aromaticivorans TaxID=2026199 RepID=UPI00145624C0|nr:DUF6543 domain-containing protein [Paraburkholderia aromaticivorans]
MVDYEHPGDNRFIIRNDQAYPVKTENGQTSIYDPQHPERPAYPVSYDAATGSWSVHDDAGQAPAGGMLNVPNTYVSKPDGQLSPDSQSRGVYRDGKGQAFIRQEGKTYAVAYDKDNETWRVRSPEAGTKPSYPVRLNSNGKWELKPDVGLPGGGRPSKYTDELGQQLYTEYQNGSLTYGALATRYGLTPAAVFDYVARYAKEHGLPLRGEGNIRRNWAGASSRTIKTDSRPLKSQRNVCVNHTSDGFRRGATRRSSAALSTMFIEPPDAAVRRRASSRPFYVAPT